MQRIISLPQTEWQALANTDAERAALLLAQSDGDQPWAGRTWTWVSAVEQDQRVQVTYSALDQ